MTYQAPVTELLFVLNGVLGAERLAATDRYAEATVETSEAILKEAAKLAEEVLAPVNRLGDLHPARLENGVVRCSPGFSEAHGAVAEGGWIGMNADPTHGGMGLPMTLTASVAEMMNSANMALTLIPLLTQGQIEALETHASDEIKRLYLPKLTSGVWNGTMNLTEPQAGSDVGALTSRAEPVGDGTYRIFGQKIYITWGDNDICENTCHLVLARLPGAPAGTKGISLFLVPKFIPDENGNPGPRNGLRVIGLEHKLGLHGSPTCTMEFDGATGWMIGPENGGMAAMFTMMNNARLGVGVEGVGIAERALQESLAFARDRRQGRPVIADGTGAIIDHADVRRMLMTMKAMTQAARAICLDTALSIDMAKATAAEAWSARAAFLTPIAKAFATDVGSEVADLAIQVHGGMGFVEETGVAQLARDVRVARIYEGTNGIQAMDLVGRKLMDQGDAAEALLGEIEETAKAAQERFTDLADLLQEAGECLAETLRWMIEAGMNDRFAGATPFLRAFGLTLGGHYLLKAALVDGSPDRAALAAFHARQIMPQVDALCRAAREGSAPLYAIDPEAFAAS
ncbi:MAG: acyl-CoA dehydrogenase [Rubricella sp.]